MRHISEATTRSDTAPYNVWGHLPVICVGDISDLHHAFVPNIDAAICQRIVPATVSHWLNSLPPDRLPEGRFVLRQEQVFDCAKDLFITSGHEPCPALNWVCNDAANLAKSVLKTVPSDLIRLRLEVVTDNACAKLHVDNVVARLICTYRGPGTEIGLEEAEAKGIRGVPTGMPILLKGRRWRDGHDRHLRHRSPPIKGTGQTRLVLVLEGLSRTEVLPEYDMIYDQS